MKFRNLYFAMAAGLAFTACSSDEPANSGNDNNGDFNYVAVRLCTPGSMGSRYTDKLPEYENGSTEESAVTNAMFVFFGPNGNISEIVPDVTISNWKDGKDHTIDKEAKTVVTLKGSSIKPDCVIAILNPPTGLEATLRSKGNLDAVRKTVGAYTSTESGKFVMTNSAYNDGDATGNGNNIYAAKITGKIFDTYKEADETLTNTVDIYVERVLAKVRVKKNSEFKVGSNDIEITDAESNKEEVTVLPVVKGYRIINTTSTTTLVKNIDDVSQLWDWNDKDNFRSYWATVPQSDVKHLTWNQISGENADATFSEYLCPNNMDSALPLQDGMTSKATKIIVAAELQIAGKATNLIRYMDKYFKNDNDYLTRMAYELKTAGVQWQTTDDAGTKTKGDYAVEDLEVVRVKTGDKVHPYRITAKVKEAVLAAKPLLEESVYDDFITSQKPAIEWKNGLTYFFAEIKHIGFTNQKSELAALIRNHIYDVTLDGITGLGTPVFDPTEEIDPERPTDEPESYVSARIALLKWRVVGQHLTLE